MVANWSCTTTSMAEQLRCPLYKVCHHQLAGIVLVAAVLPAMSVLWAIDRRCREMRFGEPTRKIVRLRTLPASHPRAKGKRVSSPLSHVYLREVNVEGLRGAVETRLPCRASPASGRLELNPT